MIMCPRCKNGSDPQVRGCEVCGYNPSMNYDELCSKVDSLIEMTNDLLIRDFTKFRANLAYYIKWNFPVPHNKSLPLIYQPTRFPESVELVYV